ncbi:hypothetical protein Q5H93_06175 [Hymenobacter sp. ASUV-10]|uniref:Guanylate cyclase domain-containing protein n=1 Tax=Hymenobacter aranciens TaxID=3063996 RepID=A0ABT9B7Q9_9BACT|nr:hypothetical protein [Hymenobacter sp. ASUV-10]MDO7874312.1 hypothetical protein [Hymenobacter sp. ASUV-10]
MFILYFQASFQTFQPTSTDNMIDAPLHLVAFVDILGFSQIIQEFDKGETPAILEELKNALDPAVSLIKPNGFKFPGDNPFYDWKECLTAKLFSDCLCVAVPMTYKGYSFHEQLRMLYMYLSSYQSMLMEQGYLTRGGITIGSYYSDENMIFSGGLVEAYQLESKVAKFPRVILSERLREAVLAEQQLYAHLNRIMFVEDGDSQVFINHFNYNMLHSDYLDNELEQLLGPNGVISTSFLELDTNEKRRQLETVKGIYEGKQKAGLDARVAEKYQWILDFAEYELMGDNSRGFNSWPRA